MLHLLLFAGIPIGRVMLDDGEPAAGLLEPLPACAQVADVFRAAGDACRRSWGVGHLANAAVAMRDRARTTQQDFARAVAQLSLATEAGTAVTVERLDFWDSSQVGDAPFVLVYRGAAMAAVPARRQPRPDRDGDARPAA